MVRVGQLPGITARRRGEPVVDVRADLSVFGLGSMVRLVGSLRDLSVDCVSVSQFAQQVCEFLHDSFVDAEGIRQTALVRYYATGPLDGLPAADQEFAARRATASLPSATASLPSATASLPSATASLPSATTCLTLLGTAGTLAAWNDRTASAGHRVVPLLDPAQVAGLPMVAALLGQLGIDLTALLEARSDVLLPTHDENYRVFHVPVAVGSSFIPDQEFVAAHGICSALGFGGALPTGEVFAVVLFSRVPVPLASAQLFGTVALSTTLVGLTLLDLPWFPGESAASRSGHAGLTAGDRARARDAVLRSLLVVHERAAGAEADKAELALGQARYEASIAAALSAVSLRLGAAQTMAEVTEVLVEDGVSVLGAGGLSLALTNDARTAATVALSASFGASTVARYATMPLDDTLPAVYTARTGELVIINDAVAGLARFPALATVSRSVSVAALVALPLRVDERLIGSMTCAWSEPRQFNPVTLEVMKTLAAQAALAVDRTRLLEGERLHSRALQRSLLSDPPEHADYEIAVRYHPATSVAQVGGDWYDAFLQRDGGLMVVIGDVIGHDTAAAAAMGQVRVLLRGIAWHGGAGPASVLCAVDAASAGLATNTTASAVVARLERACSSPSASAVSASAVSASAAHAPQAPAFPEPAFPERAPSAPRSREGEIRLRWSNAGHPPPMVISPAGEVEVLHAAEPDLLLGIIPGASRQESEVVLSGGATVVLYTDGLVERRDQGLGVGMESLRCTLADLAGLPLHELCDELLRRALPDAEDDVALLAVRLRA